jgi:MinD-like ATPase involved in chromosome partitioning or flagellar assembly
VSEPVPAGRRPSGGSGRGPHGRGRMVAIWGPTGAPGRTTVAVTLAAELAELGPDTLLVDADTYGPCVAQALGLLDESGGIAGAVRSAGQGTLDVVRLARLAPALNDRFRVLTGLPQPARWPELRPSALEALWDCCRELAGWTVVDCGFGLEADEELSFDTAAPRRNGATLSALAAADVVLAVGTADPVGLQRLVRGLSELSDALGPAIDPRVVVTRVRAAAVGPNPERRVREALARYAGIDDALLVPDDRAGCDAAMLAGRSLTESQPSSPARIALAELAAVLNAAVTTSAGTPSTALHRAGTR